MGNIQHIVYYEDNPTFAHKEDSYLHKKNIFAVSDGITHDLLENNLYPITSDASLVANIATKSLVEYCSNRKVIDNNDIKKAFIHSNSNIRLFNSNREFWKNREKRAYDFGACVASLAIFENDELKYGILDDCRISVFGNDLKDRIKIKNYVELSANYFKENYQWSEKKDRTIWRKDIRNNINTTKNGVQIGYGALDGRTGFVDFLQIGSTSIGVDDLICVYTDGFIEAINDIKFIKMIKYKDLNNSILVDIRHYMNGRNLVKEKTAFFIKIS